MTLEQHGTLGRFKAGDPCYLRCRVVGHDSKVETNGIPRVALEIIGKDGKWSFTSENTVEPGDHKLRLDALDGDANVIARVEVPFTRAAPEAVAVPKDGKVIIQPGNNLWRISRVLYGDGSKFTMLYEANKDQIRDPNRIYPGQVFKTPDVVPAAESVDPKRRDQLKPEENAGSGQ